MRFFPYKSKVCKLIRKIIFQQVTKMETIWEPRVVACWRTLEQVEKLWCLGFEQAYICAFTFLGQPSDWRNLIASWITRGALAKNSLLRAYAFLGLVKTQSWTLGANKIKIKIQNTGSQIMSKVINELRTSVFNLKFF